MKFLRFSKFPICFQIMNYILFNKEFKKYVYIIKVKCKKPYQKLNSTEKVWKNFKFQSAKKLKNHSYLNFCLAFCLFLNYCFEIFNLVWIKIFFLVNKCMEDIIPTMMCHEFLPKKSISNLKKNLGNLFHKKKFQPTLKVCEIIKK